jgi:hypothetical protein
MCAAATGCLGQSKFHSGLVADAVRRSSSSWLLGVCSECGFSCGVLVLVVAVWHRQLFWHSQLSWVTASEAWTWPSVHPAALLHSDKVLVGADCCIAILGHGSCSCCVCVLCQHIAVTLFAVCALSQHCESCSSVCSCAVMPWAS